jgi:predicted nucleic acid-binding protein
VSFLLDTNVISEVRKGQRCDPRVADWYASIDDEDIFLSVLVLGEIRKGIEKARRKDNTQAQALEKWLSSVNLAFADRILSVDKAVSDMWGRMSAQRQVPTTDGLLAATAKVNDMTLVTRNISDVTGLGAKVLNPFA